MDESLVENYLKLDLVWL